MKLQKNKPYLRQNQIRVSSHLKQKSMQACSCVREILRVVHKHTKNVVADAVYIRIQTLRLAYVWSLGSRNFRRFSVKYILELIIR
jgi:hypothetical protein